MATGSREVFRMAQWEIDRLPVIRWAIQRRITQAKAGELLGLSREQVNRIVGRVRVEGDRGVIHGLRGRPSNHRLAVEVVEGARKRLEERYRDFGPTLAAEKLALEGISVSVETIRQLMIAHGFWVPRRRRVRHRSWRERKECAGEMIQLDGSHHDWFEGRREQCVLLAAIDDATNRVLLRFVEHESTKELMRFGRAYVERFGRPLSFYADKDSIFQTNRQASVEEQLRDEQPLTQFARAMEQLGIELIKAHSPQAKGRVERLFGTLQDRLVKELRLAGISTIEEANGFLETTYTPWHNGRFGVQPKNPSDVHRPLGKLRRKLDIIFSIQQSRRVAHDYTIRWHNRWFQIEKHQPCSVLPRSSVTIEERLDGSLHIRYNTQYLNAHEISREKITQNRSVARRAAPLLTTPTARPRMKRYIPPEDHPWRKSHDRRQRFDQLRRKEQPNYRLP